MGGDRRRHDRQRPAARVAERRTDRATPGILRCEGERGSGQANDVQERDIEVGVEQDGDRVEDAAAGRGHAHAARRRPRPRRAHWSRRSHSATTKPVPTDDRPQVAAETLSVLASATCGDRPRRGIGRPIDRRPGQRLEADEDVGEPGVVEPAAEPDGDLGRWREDRGHRPDGGRAAGGLGQAGHRAFGQEAAREPHDQQCLDRPEAGAHRPVGRPEQAVAEPPGDRAADARADRFADGDRADQGGKDDERPEDRVDLAECVAEERQGVEDGRASRGWRPSSPRTCGIAPERQPRMAATTTSSSVTASMGFTGRSSHRPAEGALGASAGRSAGVPEPASRPRSGQATVIVIGAAPPVVSLMV